MIKIYCTSLNLLHFIYFSNIYKKNSFVIFGEQFFGRNILKSIFRKKEKNIA